MSQLFENVLTASFHGSIVIAAVCLLRPLLRKTPRKFLCLLWMLAFIRLLMPFEIQSDLSLQPETVAVVQEQTEVFVPVLPQQELELPPDTVAEVLPQAPVTTVEDTDPLIVMDDPAPSASVDQPTEEAEAFHVLSLIPYLWIGVAACFGLYCLAAYVKLKLLVREAVKIPGGWECDRIDTAFILGFIRPKIYIPMGMPESVCQHILAHERTHLEKGDHWYKMLGYVALAIHWFNPLVWLAYILLCKDIELACDERVVQFMELPERKAYSAALLRCSTNKAHFAACPVAFGEVSVTERIVTVLKYKKPSFWISLLGVIAIVFVAVCLMTSPTEKPLEETPEDAIVVSNVDELLAAIEPGAVIQLEDGVYTLNQAADYGQPTNKPYYRWEQVSDGYELVISSVENLTIRGRGQYTTTVDTDPRYADVIQFEGCMYLTLEDMTIGHTRQRAECGGGVLRLEGCTSVDMSGLGLYGCGVVGVIAEESALITIADSDIYECSSSAIDLFNTNDVEITGCRIREIAWENGSGYAFFQMSGSDSVTISDCQISDSTLEHLLVSYDSEVLMENNYFSNNRVRDSAFNIEDKNLTLESNRFENNSVRDWYDHLYGGQAEDRSDNILTEDWLHQQNKVETTANFAPQLQIHVSTVDELIAAIGPDREIILDAASYDFSVATGYGVSKGDYYYWENIYDGPGLVITGVSNMTIRGVSGDRTAHLLEAVPRYAEVLMFNGCSDITLSGFTAGHTREPGVCAGGVFEFRDCDNMTVDNCGLFGCGILGVETDDCSNITVKNSDIYECSQGGIKLRDTYGATIENNIFRDLGGSNMHFISCSGVTVDGQLVLPEDGIATVEIQTSQQAAVTQLNGVVNAFANDFFSGRDYSQYLVSDYSGEKLTYNGDPKQSVVMFFELGDTEVYEIEQNGSCVVQVPYRRERTTSSPKLTMPVTVVKENGEYRISTFGDETTTAPMAEVKDSVDVGNLQEIALAFGNAYFSGDAAAMGRYLYAIGGQTARPYENAGEPGMIIGCDIPEEWQEQLEAYGSCNVFLPYHPDIAVGHAEDMISLRLHMIRSSQNSWKVMSYVMEGTEVADLERLLYNFAWSYWQNDTLQMAVFLSDDYSQPIEGYTGPVEQLVEEEYNVLQNVTEAELKAKVDHTVTIPFRTSLNGPIQNLNVTAIKQSGRWQIAAYDLNQGTEETSTLLAEGVTLRQFTRETYDGAALLIDDPSKVFLATSAEELSSEMPGKRMPDILEAYPDAIAAINAGAFYDDGTTSSIVGSTPLGLTISEGEVVWSEGALPGMYGFAGFDENNKLVVQAANVSEDRAKDLKIRDGCSYGPALIVDGIANHAALEANSGYNARSAIGQKQDGTVILLCINGRHWESIGASYGEVLREMQELGAVNACLLNGGSATALATKDREGNVELRTRLAFDGTETRRQPAYWMVRLQ